MDASKLPTEEIGLLTQPVEPARWLAYVRERYCFALELDPTERWIARCNPGDRYQVACLVAGLVGQADTG